MMQTTVTAENLETVRQSMPCDQAAEVEVGCVVTRWSPGDVLLADGQHNSEPITTTVWPSGRGAWCYGGDSVWGDVTGDLLTPDEGVERYDLSTGAIISAKTAYEVRTEGASQSIEADTLEGAKEAAEEWLEEGWEPVEETMWVHGYLIETAPDGDVTEHALTVTIHPMEPACLDNGAHDWQSPFSIVGGIKENPGVWGHGGGVTIQEVCMRCGCGRLTDTWAQDPETGRQGLRSVTYEPGKYTVPQEVDDGR